MKVIFKEINYKEVEVPDGTSLEELGKMVENYDVIVGDTTEADYEVNVNGEWYSILQQKHKNFKASAKDAFCIPNSLFCHINEIKEKNGG